MTFKQKVGYFFLSLTMLVILALIEFFLCGGIVNLINDAWQTRTIAFIVMIVLFNPFIVYKIMEFIPFKVKGLKVSKGINEALKHENAVEEES